MYDKSVQEVNAELRHIVEDKDLELVDFLQLIQLDFQL